MWRFGRTSRARLETCDQRLIALFNYVVLYRDCIIIEGFRGKEKQNKAFEEGFSKVQWPDGKHNTMVEERGILVPRSKAVDVAPYDADRDPKIDWDNMAEWEEFCYFVQAAARRLGIKVKNGLLSWGWDAPHWEVIDDE